MAGPPTFNPFAAPVFATYAKPVPYPVPLMPQQSGLAAATGAMNLTPQEQALYQRHITNLYGPGGVDNSDASRSSLYQAVEPHNGQFYNIPTVWNGNIETQLYQRPSDGRQFDIPNQTALANVNQAGWNTFPSYPSAQQADDRYMKMHDYMDTDTADYKQNVQQSGGLLSLLGIK